MNVLIIEDEENAARLLSGMIKSLRPDWQILDVLDTVKSGVRWLREHPAPDLIFMDIQLADGISFQIVEQCKPEAPIIFTTAYNEYAVKAFKVNSIDYILKPVDSVELANALDKFSRLNAPPVETSRVLQSIGQAMEMLTKRYKERFMIRVGEHLKTIEVASILYFYSQDKVSFCCTNDGRQHILDFSMDTLEEMLDPSKFFRVNRKYIVRAEAVQDIVQYTNSRLRLVLKGSQDNDVVVARERVAEFKQWLDS